MIIDCISDLHGYYPKLEGGDLLIVAGDLTARDTKDELFAFHEWVTRQLYKKTIIIAGNHDNQLQESVHGYPFYNRPWSFNIHVMPSNDVVYLCDSVAEFEGLKIWGSPWTKTFHGMNPHCKAFTVDTEEELAVKFSLIHDDVDILVTHSPPKDIHDEIVEERHHAGSTSLENALRRIQPKLHVFGHIHEAYGISKTCCWSTNGQIRVSKTTFINASHVNEHYKPVNRPIRIEL